MEQQEAYQQVARYLLHEMTEEERKSFEALLATDTALRNLHDDVAISVQAIRNKGLKKELKEIHAELYETPKKPKQQYLLITLGIAASLILLLVSNLFFNSDKAGSEEIFAKYFEAFPDYLTMRTEEGKGPLYEGMEAYRSGDYPKAIALMESIEDKTEPSPDRWFYLGITQLAVGDAEKAIDSFKQQASIDGKYKEQINWYLALAYLKSGDKAQALSTLKTIEAGDFEFERAALLMEELQDVDFE